MRVLITSPEMAIEHDAERDDGPRDLADALRHTIATYGYSQTPLNELPQDTSNKSDVQDGRVHQTHVEHIGGN